MYGCDGGTRGVGDTPSHHVQYVTMCEERPGEVEAHGTRMTSRGTLIFHDGSCDAALVDAKRVHAIHTGAYVRYPAKRRLEIVQTSISYEFISTAHDINYIITYTLKLNKVHFTYAYIYI